MTDTATALARSGRGDGRVSRHEPVFLLAPARSYSTVSLALLAGHPRLYGFPEMLTFAHATVGGLFTEREDRPRSWTRSQLHGVCRAIAQVHDGEQTQAAIGRAKAWLAQRAEWGTVDLLDYLLDQVEPNTGLEKSPETTGSDESLARCLAAYPRARYIHLTRHPVGTVRSMREHWAKCVPGGPDKALNATCATAWYLSHQRVMRALDELPPERWMRVRAEDLLREPRAWLPKILSWLGLDSGAATVEGMLHTEQWCFARPDEQGRLLGGGDPKFLAAPALRPVDAPGPLVFDADLGFPAEMERRMRELARQLGY
jgi:hypothetical protein